MIVAEIMLEPLKHILDKSTVILASASPRRREILDNVGLKFSVRPSNVDENLPKERYVGRPFDYTVDTAELKANDVFSKAVTECAGDADLVVIGCDTVVTHESVIHEKPVDTSDAKRMLQILSGARHIVYSGVKLIRRTSAGERREAKFFEATEVEFADLTDQVIDRYIVTGEPMDKAGGYGIQGKGGTLVRAIAGDYFNVMGFPVHAFSVQLTQLMKD